MNEDQRCLAWSRHPVGVFVVSALRMMALTILAVAPLAYLQEHPKISGQRLIGSWHVRPEFWVRLGDRVFFDIGDSALWQQSQYGGLSAVVATEPLRHVARREVQVALFLRVGRLLE